MYSKDNIYLNVANAFQNYSNYVWNIKPKQKAITEILKSFLHIQSTYSIQDS